jgi:hypothetical protein
MISSRIRQLAIVLMLAWLCIPALSQEPNQPKPELQFETSGEERPWVRDSKDRPGSGPIKPTCAAEFLLYRAPAHSPQADLRTMRTILKTEAGRSLSEIQRDFLTKSDALVWTDAGHIGRRYRLLRLYAVSQDDAKTMVRAVNEYMTVKANEQMQDMRKNADEYEERIADIRRELPQKQVKLEAASVSYQEIKKRTHDLSSDSDAAKEAKETILEMNKVLDAIAIEIAGIEAKLSAIEQYKSKKNVSIEGLAKVEQILSEQTIELAGALARRKATLRIRGREETFLNRNQQWHHLTVEVNDLQNELPERERSLQWHRERLANPDSDMLPPQIYQNKVTIHPVRVDG